MGCLTLPSTASHHQQHQSHLIRVLTGTRILHKPKPKPKPNSTDVAPSTPADLMIRGAVLQCASRPRTGDTPCKPESSDDDEEARSCGYLCSVAFVCLCHTRVHSAATLRHYVRLCMAVWCHVFINTGYAMSLSTPVMASATHSIYIMTARPRQDTGQGNEEESKEEEEDDGDDKECFAACPPALCWHQIFTACGFHLNCTHRTPSITIESNPRGVVASSSYLSIAGRESNAGSDWEGAHT